MREYGALLSLVDLARVNLAQKVDAEPEAVTVQSGAWQMVVQLGSDEIPAELDPSAQYMLRAYQQGGPDIVTVFAFDLVHADTMVPCGLSAACCFGSAIAHAHLAALRRDGWLGGYLCDRDPVQVLAAGVLTS